ncbi:hypothetical protein DFH08DRAFT_395556 [Mycena albidolilacea]|uniref:Uncharacterized protein n=1 Tax=Mycena albidolilacea TaxID=1033008 RepID=A0AAD6ZDW3_9AGAR|nr:hypothetical protein DFH08DRAFT_395556 [Mycena albidolilacea]
MKAATGTAKKRTEQGAMNWAFDDLIDDPQPSPPPTTAPQRGRPKAGILDQLTIACHTKSTDVPRIRCAGEGCHESWSAPRMSGRILPHASVCQFLPADTRKLALLENAKASLGSKVEAASSRPNTDMFADFRRAGSQNKEDARKAHVTKTNKLVLDLLCDGALAPKLVDRRAF